MRRVFVVILILLVAMCFFACNKNIIEEQAYPIKINGDIVGIQQIINLGSLTETENEKLADIDDTSKKAYKLSTVISEVELLTHNSYLMFTALDNASAMIDIDTADDCYILAYNDELFIDAPKHPRAVGIKNLKEITVIAKEPTEVTQGIKIVTEEKVEILSVGNSKLWFYDETAENYQGDNVAYKYQFNDKEIKLEDIVSTDNNYIYCTDFDIIKTKDNQGTLFWNGGLGYKDNNQKTNSIIGIVTDVDLIIYDAYKMMKQELDNNNKVMFILPDGLSYQQVQHYADDLSLFKENYRKATSVHPAISNVALASIVTGASPKETEITKREVKKPACADIFDYALSRGKTAKYIEGNGNLIVTNIQPIFNALDPNGYSDDNVFDSAMTALQDDPDLIFIHFHGIDDVNHEYSPISSRAKAKILKTENYIEQLVQEFDGTVIIVPDHGAITYFDSDNNKKGKHGLLQNEDMYVPFYVINK